MQTRTKARAHDGKRVHKTKGAAEAAKWILVKTKGSDPKRLTVYPCDHTPMRHWHVGHC